MPGLVAELLEDVEGALVLVGGFVVVPAVFRADRAAVQMGASEEVRGGSRGRHLRRARPRRTAWPSSTEPPQPFGSGRTARVAFTFAITRGGITALELVADPELHRHLDLAILGHWQPRRRPGPGQPPKFRADPPWTRPTA